jgi:hypothetical protein
VLFLVAGTLAACGLGACRPGALDPADAGGGAATGACRGGAVHSYLVRSLVALEFTDADVLVHGFDLDGRASDGTAPEDCHVADRNAPDGRVGIDNTIAGFWGEDFSVAFDQSYALGNAPLVARLSGVDSFDNDDCVDIEWFGAEWVDAPIDPASPQAAGRHLRRGATSSGSSARIEAGRLVADGSAPVELRASAGARAFVFPLTILRISAAISSEALTQGEMGGHAHRTNVHSAYRSLGGGLISPEIVNSILFPDLPSGQTPCTLLSAGFGFDAVRVTIVP